MQLAISNLAWKPEQDEDIARLLSAEGVSAVEIAPTKLWPDLLSATPQDLRNYRKFWESRGIRIVALQSLLFGHPELVLFDGDEARENTFSYLCRVMDIATELGAGPLVFGSPKNRLVPAGLEDESWSIALDFFGRIADEATSRGVSLCMEHNPTHYGCNFVTRPQDAASLVKAVGKRGFELHLDTGCAHLSGDDLTEVLPTSMDMLAHFHVSREQLLPVGPDSPVPYDATLQKLGELGYAHHVSIEMREAGTAEQNLEAVRTAVSFVGSKLHGTPLAL